MKKQKNKTIHLKKKSNLNFNLFAPILKHRYENLKKRNPLTLTYFICKISIHLLKIFS